MAVDEPITGPRIGLGRRAVRNTGGVLVARVASRVVALVTVVLIGRALGDAHFGEMQTAVTYSAVISIVSDFGFATMFVREGARQPEALRRFLDFALSFRILLTAVAAPLLLGALWFAGLRSLWLPTLAILAVGGFLMLLRGALYALQDLTFEIAEIVPESLLLLGLVTLGYAHHADTGYFLWAYAASYAAAAMYFIVVLATKGLLRPRWSLDRTLIRPWVGAGLSLSVTYLLTTVYFKVDVPILQRFRPYTEVGWYTLAYKPFEALLFVPVTLRSVVFPVLSVFNREQPMRVLPTIEKLYKGLALLGWPATVGLFLLAPQLNELLHLYPQCAAALRILALALVFAFVDNTFSATWYATDRQKIFAYIALSGLALNVILNLFLIPRFGYLGASWATVVTEIWLVGVGWAVLRRLVGRLRVIGAGWRVYAAGLVMGAVVWWVNPSGPVATVAVVVLGAAVYGAALVLLGALDADDRSAIRHAVGRRQS
ncbi:MAG: flippase [Candidatus Dormibacteria bacterium]